MVKFREAGESGSEWVANSRNGQSAEQAARFFGIEPVGR
ncbi:MAG: hypothetical protein AKCLJLPJ_01637 [Fimbriimonadales bacterium]|nr:hypothetical protein [Fimbriimonadales bacterium]